MRNCGYFTIIPPCLNYKTLAKYSTTHQIKDLLLFAQVVVKTANAIVINSFAADGTKLFLSARRTCSTPKFPLQPIKSLISSVVVAGDELLGSFSNDDGNGKENVT